MSDQTLPGWAWVVAVIIALGVLGGAAWLLLRRRTEVEVLDPERAWSRVLALLAEQDVRLGPSVTLRRAPAFIADEVRTRTGTPLPDDVAERLTALADAAEEERYARSLDAAHPGGARGAHNGDHNRPGPGPDPPECWVFAPPGPRKAQDPAPHGWVGRGRQEPGPSWGPAPVHVVVSGTLLCLTRTWVWWSGHGPPTYWSVG